MFEVRGDRVYRAKQSQFAGGEHQKAVAGMAFLQNKANWRAYRTKHSQFRGVWPGSEGEMCETKPNLGGLEHVGKGGDRVWPGGERAGRAKQSQFPHEPPWARDGMPIRAGCTNKANLVSRRGWTTVARVTFGADRAKQSQFPRRGGQGGRAIGHHVPAGPGRSRPGRYRQVIDSTGEPADNWTRVLAVRRDCGGYGWSRRSGLLATARY